MNITCIICYDQIYASSKIYTTQCGHIFHYNCLDQWIERSKTCPQCRYKTTKRSIRRLYLNIANTEHTVDDVGTLQSKFDSRTNEVRMRDKDISNSKDHSVQPRGSTAIDPSHNERRSSQLNDFVELIRQFEILDSQINISEILRSVHDLNRRLQGVTDPFTKIEIFSTFSNNLTDYDI